MSNEFEIHNTLLLVFTHFTEKKFIEHLFSWVLALDWRLSRETDSKREISTPPDEIPPQYLSTNPVPVFGWRHNEFIRCRTIQIFLNHFVCTSFSLRSLAALFTLRAVSRFVSETTGDRCIAIEFYSVASWATIQTNMKFEARSRSSRVRARRFGYNFYKLRASTFWYYVWQCVTSAFGNDSKRRTRNISFCFGVLFYIGIILKLSICRPAILHIEKTDAGLSLRSFQIAIINKQSAEGNSQN